MKNGIDDLRDHLFAALEGLADHDDPLDLDRAKAISEVAQTVINSAKVEVDYLKVTGGESQTALLRERLPTPPLKAVGGGR